MSRNAQLLKQVRSAIDAVGREHPDPGSKAMLSYADILLNELMLQEDPTFYLDYLARGRALLVEGERQLATGDEKTSASDLRDLHADLSSVALQKELERLNARLVTVVARLDERRSVEVKAYLDRVCLWEKSLYDHRMQEARQASEPVADPFTEDALLTYLVKRFPTWKRLRLTSFEHLWGGFSKKTILFGTDDDVNGPQAMVLRAEQNASMLRFSQVTQEFPVVQYLREAGVPVAEPLWLEEDTGHFGTPFMVSRKAPGSNFGVSMGGKDSISPELLDSIIAALCSLHNVRVRADDTRILDSPLAEWLPYRKMREATSYWVTDYLWKWIRITGVEVTPQLMRALNWLKVNVPEDDGQPVILHLDFGLNNLLIENERVTTILDLESVRLGDPADDIITTQLALAEHISMEDFLERYALGTGHRVSPYRIAYARIAKAALYEIIFRNAGRMLHHDDTAHIKLTFVYYRLTSMYGSNFNNLIAEAERLQNSETK